MYTYLFSQENKSTLSILCEEMDGSYIALQNQLPSLQGSEQLRAMSKAFLLNHVREQLVIFSNGSPILRDEFDQFKGIAGMLNLQHLNTFLDTAFHLSEDASHESSVGIFKSVDSKHRRRTSSYTPKSKDNNPRVSRSVRPIAQTLRPEPTSRKACMTADVSEPVITEQPTMFSYMSTPDNDKQLSDFITYYRNREQDELLDEKAHAIGLHDFKYSDVAQKSILCSSIHFQLTNVKLFKAIAPQDLEYLKNLTNIFIDKNLRTFLMTAFNNPQCSPKSSNASTPKKIHRKKHQPIVTFFKKIQSHYQFTSAESLRASDPKISKTTKASRR